MLLGRGWADPLQALAEPRERPVLRQQPGAADSLFPDSDLCPGPASDRSPLGLLSGPWEVCASCDSPSGVTTLTLVQANCPSCRADSGLCGPFAFSPGSATSSTLGSRCSDFSVVPMAWGVCQNVGSQASCQRLGCSRSAGDQRGAQESGVLKTALGMIQMRGVPRPHSTGGPGDSASWTASWAQPWLVEILASFPLEPCSCLPPPTSLGMKGPLAFNDR